MDNEIQLVIKNSIFRDLAASSKCTVKRMQQSRLFSVDMCKLVKMKEKYCGQDKILETRAKN